MSSYLRPFLKCIFSVSLAQPEISILESIAEPEQRLRYAIESTCITIIYEMKIRFSDTYGSIQDSVNHVTSSYSLMPKVKKNDRLVVMVHFLLNLADIASFWCCI